jgi:hypothetical protein
MHIQLIPCVFHSFNRENEHYYGNPAVPTIKASVIAKTSTIDFVPLCILKIQDPWKGRLVYPIDKCRFPELALPFLIAEQGFLSFDRNKDSRNHESKY